MSIQQLRERRAKIAQTLQGLINDDHTWDAATDQPIYDNAMQELEEIDAAIERINAANERLASEAVDGQLQEAGERAARDTNNPAAALYAKWLAGGDKALTASDWEAYRATMSTGTDTEGGFTVDSEVATVVIEALKKFGGMREVATVISTMSGNQMSFPTSDGTAEEGEIVAENASASDEDASFGTVGLPVFKFSSKVFGVPFELLQDSNVDIEAFVSNRMVSRLGRITNRLFTVGTGTAQPRGVVTASARGLQAANGEVNNVSYDTLVDFEHSVDPIYRETGRCNFMFNDNTLRGVRKIKDSTGRPIFVPGYELSVPGGAPDTLMGYGIKINQSVRDMAASARSMVFGDLSAYYIRDAMQIEMFRFTDSAYTKKGQVGFLAWMRSGGNLIDASAVKHLANAAN